MKALKSFSAGPHRRVIWMKLWKYHVVEIGEKKNAKFVSLPPR